MNDYTIYLKLTHYCKSNILQYIFLKIVSNFHLVRCHKNLEGVMFERILVKEQEFLYLNLAVI